MLFNVECKDIWQLPSVYVVIIQKIMTLKLYGITYIIGKTK